MLATIRACVYNRNVMPIPDDLFDNMVAEVKAKERGVLFSARGFPPCYGLTKAETTEVSNGMVFVEVAMNESLVDFLDSRREKVKLSFIEASEARNHLGLPPAEPVTEAQP